MFRMGSEAGMSTGPVGMEDKHFWLFHPCVLRNHSPLPCLVPLIDPVSHAAPSPCLFAFMRPLQCQQGNAGHTSNTTCTANV